MFSRIPNLRIYKFFPQFFSYFLLRQSRILLFKNDQKMYLHIATYFHKKGHFAATSTENRGFVDSEFVKTCHEQVIIIQCNAVCSHQTNRQK